MEQQTKNTRCKFCGSIKLRVVPWADDTGEYDAIECTKCLASAPATIWNNRAPMQMQEPVTAEQYARAIVTLVTAAKGDTSAALPAATVLLSAYNGQAWQLDIVDLCHLDGKHYQAALTVIRGRVELSREPQDFIQQGNDIFPALWEQWRRYNINNRHKPTCSTCYGSGKQWEDEADETNETQITCRQCAGDGIIGGIE